MRSYIQNQCSQIAENYKVSASAIVRMLAKMDVYPDGTDLGHIGKLNTQSEFVERIETNTGKPYYKLNEKCLAEIEKGLPETAKRKKDNVSTFEDFMSMMNDYQQMKANVEQLNHELEKQIEINDYLKIQNHELTENNTQLMREKQELISQMQTKETADFKTRFAKMNEDQGKFANELNKTYSELYEAQKQMALLNNCLGKLKNDTVNLQKRMDAIYREAKVVLNG